MFAPNSWRLLVCLVTIASAGCLTATCDAQGPAAQKTMRNQVEGQGWRLDRAALADAKLPRVLLIGDSILSGYHRQVIDDLAGRANIDVWINPYHQSKTVNRILADVLQQGPYDVVHFNIGLHGWPQGRIKEGTFELLTKSYVDVLRYNLPKAHLIWASTTPVTVKDNPSELDPEVNPIIIEHNRMAAGVMKEMEVQVVDFYSILVNQRQLARGDRFHWTAPAYKLLAAQATAAISAALPQPKP